MPHNKSFRSMKESYEPPVGEWTEVPKGYVVAPGTYVDSEGYLRFSANESYAVWHSEGCERWGKKNSLGVLVPMTKDEIILESGVPWCVHCLARKEQQKDG